VRRKAEHGAKQDAKAAPERGGGRTRARTRRHKDPSSSSLLEMRNIESFLIIRRVERDCQARGIKVRIIHHRVGLYPPSNFRVQSNNQVSGWCLSIFLDEFADILEKRVNVLY
jgi:hypothetical protein